MELREFHGILAASLADAFCVAAANGELRQMKLFIADGVDINTVGSSIGETALHTAARLGLIRTVEFLLEAGADLNAKSTSDLTPLMCACSLGKKKGSRVAMRLIEAGADVKYVRTSDEMTALKFAALSCPPEVIRALIDRGAEVDGPSGTSQTALMLAARENHVAALQVLVENGANVTLPCKLKWAEGRTAEGLAELQNSRAALAYLRELRTG